MSILNQFWKLQRTKNAAGDYVMQWGTTVPTAGTAGYATGCMFFDTNATGGTTFYVNNGTGASASFAARNTA